MKDADHDIDDATDSLRGLVEAWIWYGYHPAEVIDGWIDENAAAGDGFDLAWIKAFALATMAKKRAEEAAWPEDTDCDRLDRAFARLHEQGICAVQWAGDTLSEGVEAVGERVYADGVPPGRFVGFCFFHSQDMDQALSGEGLLIAFGHVDSEAEIDIQRIGRRVCEALEHEGLRTQWDGTENTRIALPALRWQRRTPNE